MLTVSHPGIGLARGFARDVLDPFAAYGVGVVAAATVLLLFSVIEPCVDEEMMPGGLRSFGGARPAAVHGRRRWCSRGS